MAIARFSIKYATAGKRAITVAQSEIWLNMNELHNQLIITNVVNNDA